MDAEMLMLASYNIGNETGWERVRLRVEKRRERVEVRSLGGLITELGH